MYSDGPVARTGARPHVRYQPGTETTSAAGIAVLGETYSRHRDSLVRAARGVLHDVHRAEDAVQDVFVKLMERRSAAHNVTVSYLYVCVLNRCRDFARMERRARQRLRLHAHELASVTSPAPSQEVERVHDPKLLASVATSAGRLTRRQRQVLELVLSGYGTSAIARRLRIRPKTVANHYAAAIRVLRTAVGRSHSPGAVSARARPGIPSSARVN